MARKNDLEVSPAHKDSTTQQTLRAGVQSLSKTNNEVRANYEENGEMPTGSGDSNARQEDMAIASGQHREQDDDDAANESLAGIINDVLSGPTQPGSKSTARASRGSWGQAVKIGVGVSIASSQEQPKPLEVNDNPLGESTQVQVLENALQVLVDEVPDNINMFNGDKSNMGKSLAGTSAIYEDISRTQKSRSSGRPDPYDVPQSPPRSPDPEPRTRVSQRRLPKSKQVAFREKPKKTAEVVQRIPSNFIDPQEERDHLEVFPNHAKGSLFAPEERMVTSQRATRSMRTKEYDLSDMKRDREKRQRLTSTGMPEHRGISHAATFGSISSREDQSSENQAGTSIVEYQESSNAEMGSPKRGLQSKDKTAEVERGDRQPREYPGLTPKSGRQDAEKASLGRNAEPVLQGVSPILSAPTPIQKTQASSRKLPRPSITSKGTTNGKQNISTRETAKGLVGNTVVLKKTREIVQEDASDEEDDAEQESRISGGRNPGLKQTVENFIDEAILNQLLSTIRQAGRNADDKKVIQDNEFQFEPAGTLCRAARRLAARYEAMSSLLTASVIDVKKHDIEREKAKRYLEVIENETKIVLTEGRGGPELDARTKVLEDIYLRVVPNLVKSLKAAAKSHKNRAAPATSDLEEFLSLLKILYDLVNAAVLEDKLLQPKAPRKTPYSISQPTIRIRLNLKNLYKKCKIELAAREVAEKLEQSRQNAPEKMRKRKEQIEAEERAAEDEYRRRQKSRNRAIVDSLNERRAELGLPPCTQHEETSHDRLTGVFGRNNTHPGTMPKDWTKIEMEILVDGLRRERGPTRYEKLATRLERTLDEIFERAKYLKMQMEYTLKRLQEENPDTEFPTIKPWIENIGSEGFLNQ